MGRMRAVSASSRNATRSSGCRPRKSVSASRTNPVTRYLDRRREERGGVWIAQYNLPWHPYWMWMSNSHDLDFPEYYAPSKVHPHLHFTDDITKTLVVSEEE